MAVAFSTMTHMSVLPGPIAKLFIILEKFLTQAIKLTGQEMTVDDALEAVLENLPKEWEQHMKCFPPKLIHALLSYPEGEYSMQELLAEMQQHAPPEIQP